MTALPLDPHQRRPGFPFQDDFFTLGAAVGPDQPNRREDVIRVETILGNTGHHDLSRTDGPVGYWGQRQEQAVKDWQSQNGLKVDGLLKPGGPTITSLKQAAGSLLGGFTPPSPDEVDQHQSQRMQGEPGILNTRPARLSFPKPAQPLDLDEQSQAFNADSARALTRSSVNGDIPRIYGDFAKQAGPDAHATLMDLAEQVNTQVGRDRTDQVMHGIVSRLPPDQAKALLGGTMPAARPLGVRSADLPDDSAVPLFRAAEPVRLAQAETGAMSDAAPTTPTAPRPQTDTSIPAEQPTQQAGPTASAPAQTPAAQSENPNPYSSSPAAPTTEDTHDRTPVQRDAEVLKDPANVPGYTQWLAQGAKADPQWAEQHAKDVSREIYKSDPRAAEEMARQGEKAGVKVGLYAEGHQASKSVGDLLKDAKGGHLSSGPDAGSKECVALVKHATPELQGVRASEWKEGEKIKGPNDPPLKPGTSLATFEDGKYQNKSTGNHAVVFDRYGEEGGRKGMYVLEQARNLPVQSKFIPFGDPNEKPIYQAEKYSVIKKP